MEGIAAKIRQVYGLPSSFVMVANYHRIGSEHGSPPAVAVVAAPVSSNRPNERQQPLLVSRGNFPASPPVSVEIKTHAPGRASRLG